MQEDQRIHAHERIRVLAAAVDLPLDETRLPDLADAFDAARVLIARLEPLAASVSTPVAGVYDPAWDGEGER